MTHHTGKTLIDMGYKPGDWFRPAIAAMNADPHGDLKAIAKQFAPPPFIRRHKAGELPFFSNIEAECQLEADNILKVQAHMRELMRLPTVVAGAVMPDACPSDPRPGYIPVGGVVATKNAIHPGMHSADICCSMAVSFFDEWADPTKILDIGMAQSHFGGGGRPDHSPPSWLLEKFATNPFLKPLLEIANTHFATQGDGNHFFYVGRLASSGQIALVTHHGSRGPGAMLYKAGMKAANKVRLALCPEVAEYNSWLVADSREGQDYWAALQIIREWTKQSHFKIHDLVAAGIGKNPVHRFWNEHNFVFQRADGLFYHAKGATPAYKGFAHDDSGQTLIPLNMAEPILITEGRDAVNGLGFAPHGAGRNLSRTAHMKSHGDRSKEDIFAEETKGIDARSFSGVNDVSELPSAYKNAASVRRQIMKYDLTEVVDIIEPIGNIMAGDWQANMPWRRKKEAKTSRLTPA